MIDEKHEHNKKIAEDVVRQHKRMASQRANWESLWQETGNYIQPRKDDIFGANVPGEKKNNKLFTSISIESNEKLASLLHGTMTPPDMNWFGVSTGDKELDKDVTVKKWLDHVTDKMMGVFNNSNFQSQVHEVYLDLGSFGTSVFRILEDDRDIVRFEARPIYENYIEEDYKGTVDTVSYEYKRTVRQLAQEFGTDNFDADLMNDLEKNPSRQYEMIHMVRPRENFLPNSLSQTNKKFASLKVVKEKELLISEKGFDENPNVVTRWTKLSSETYGRSPGMKSLSDIKMANAIMKVIIQGAQKVVDPPLQVPDDGVLLPIRTSPGSINYFRSGTKDRIEPLLTGSRPDIGQSVLDGVEDRIRKAFFIDQLQVQLGDRATTAEVAQRRDEQLRFLSPITGRQQFEFLRPTVEKVFGIMVKRGEFDAAPEALSGRKLEVKYTSQVAKAQIISETETLGRVFNMIAPMLESKPQIMDNFDGDAIARDIMLNVFRLPAEYVVEEELVEEKRKAKAEEENKQAASEDQDKELEQQAMAQQIGE